MRRFHTTLPTTPENLRDQLYRGALFHLPAQPASHTLIEHIRGRLEEHRVDRDPNTFFARLTEARSKLASDEEARLRVRALLGHLGLGPAGYAVDRLRLRAVTREGHRIPEAAPAYFAHRDTWYGNPACQINVWIPVFEVTHAQSFGFYPSAFSKAVDNDSNAFDYDRFIEQVGWQNYQPGPKPTYPRALCALEDPLTFSARAGDILLFSAHHLHATLPNRGEQTRYSVDFRVVHRADHETGRGAPEVDNHSTGCAVRDYLW